MHTVVDIHFALSVFHLLVLAPLLLYVAFHRAETPTWVYLSLLAIGGLVFVYHGIKFLSRWQNRSSRAWVNLFHVSIVAPLLLWIGYHQHETPRYYYELLMILSCGLVGYHVFNLIRLLDAHPHDDE